jgi:hypothetical protein
MLLQAFTIKSDRLRLPKEPKGSSLEVAQKRLGKKRSRIKKEKAIRKMLSPSRCFGAN